MYMLYFFKEYTKQECIPVGCVPNTCQPCMWWSPLGVSSRRVGTHPLDIPAPPVGTWDQRYPLLRKGHGTREAHPPTSVNRMTDRRLWKHYLSATTVAIGNERFVITKNLLSITFLSLRTRTVWGFTSGSIAGRLDRYITTTGSTITVRVRSGTWRSNIFMFSVHFGNFRISRSRCEPAIVIVFS